MTQILQQKPPFDIYSFIEKSLSRVHSDELYEIKKDIRFFENENSKIKDEIDLFNSEGINTDCDEREIEDNNRYISELHERETKLNAAEQELQDTFLVPEWKLSDKSRLNNDTLKHLNRLLNEHKYSPTADHVQKVIDAVEIDELQNIMDRNRNAINALKKIIEILEASKLTKKDISLGGYEIKDANHKIQKAREAISYAANTINAANDKIKTLMKNQ